MEESKSSGKVDPEVVMFLSEPGCICIGDGGDAVSDSEWVSGRGTKGVPECLPLQRCGPAK